MNINVILRRKFSFLTGNSVCAYFLLMLHKKQKLLMVQKTLSGWGNCIVLQFEVSTNHKGEASPSIYADWVNGG